MKVVVAGSHLLSGSHGVDDSLSLEPGEVIRWAQRNADILKAQPTEHADKP